MKYLITFFTIICIAGCDFSLPQIANDPPTSEFSFGFKGRLENLEDAFYSSHFNYKERDYLKYFQKDPEYEFTIVRSDTIIKYIAMLQDCQSIFYLVKWNDNWNCDSSYLHINNYSSNHDSIPLDIVKSFFKAEIIDSLQRNINLSRNNYHWKIGKSNDTTYVRIVNQNNTLRKLYIFSLDSVGHDIAEKEIINYLDDSTIHYRKSEAQRYVYLESKKVIKD